MGKSSGAKNEAKSMSAAYEDQPHHSPPYPEAKYQCKIEALKKLKRKP